MVDFRLEIEPLRTKPRDLDHRTTVSEHGERKDADESTASARQTSEAKRRNAALAVAKLILKLERKR